MPIHLGPAVNALENLVQSPEVNLFASLMDHGTVTGIASPTLIESAFGKRHRQVWNLVKPGRCVARRTRDEVSASKVLMPQFISVHTEQRGRRRQPLTISEMGSRLSRSIAAAAQRMSTMVCP